MKPSALFEALHALIGQRVPLHILGACGASATSNNPKSHFETVQDLPLHRASISAFARGVAGRPRFHSRYLPAAAAFFFYSFSGQAVLPPW